MRLTNRVILHGIRVSHQRNWKKPCMRKLLPHAAPLSLGAELEPMPFILPKKDLMLRLWIYHSLPLKRQEKSLRQPELRCGSCRQRFPIWACTGGFLTLAFTGGVFIQ